MNNLKFYKITDGETVSEERGKYLKEQFEHLKNEPQPEQRTTPWYEMRNNMLTASDWGVMLGDNPYSNPKDLILKKCGHEKPFKVGPAILWGVKYEEVAVQIYEHRNQVKVIEFGLIQHPTIKYLGASPDGITKDGVMLEIKCPKSRVITGIPPVYYFDQVQGQLEVCELDRCDFLECKLAEYDSAEEYYADNFNDDYFYNNLGKEKGVVAEFFNLNDRSLKFEYGPLGGNKDTVELWENKMKIKYEDNPIYAYIGLSYWKLLDVSCIPIYRDQEWFAKAKLKLADFWNKILHYREHGVEELLIKKPSKRDLKKSKQIFVDTMIDDFASNMNTDALFEQVHKKEYMFSDDEDEPTNKIYIKGDIIPKENIFSYAEFQKTKSKNENILKNMKIKADEYSKDITGSDEYKTECMFSDDD